jgi:hypothetical protein
LHYAPQFIQHWDDLLVVVNAQLYNGAVKKVFVIREFLVAITFNG